MSSKKKQKLQAFGAIAVLATLALAVSCRGFFVNPTLTAINIDPSTPEVELNNTLNLSVYGTYNDGTTGLVTSGVSWSSGTPSVAAFTTPTSNVLQGVSLGTSTITANAQAVTATATATVYLGGITAMTVTPTSASLTGTNSQPFTFVATANGAQVDITTDNGGTITINPANVDLSCTASGDTEVCALDGNQQTTQTQSVTMSYPGTTITASATVTTGP